MAKKARPARRPAKAAARRATTRKAKPAAKAAGSRKPIDMPVASREHSISIRQIKNGYIIRESGMVGTGPKARYVESEIFSKTAPKVTIPKK
jgi:hypothetical protein